MKILIADDSPTIVDVIRFLLESQGYEVVTASDGIEAISQTYATQPDLLLLDIEMPKMNGYQVCRLLKNDELTTSIPIMMLTSRDQRRDRFWGLTTGADEFMTKDFDSEEELFEKIETLLQRHANQSQQAVPHANRQENTRPITEISVLEQVNHILDRQLFRATVVNELSSLAINMHDFSTTIHSVFHVLAKVCEFQAASILLKAPLGYSLFSYTTGGVPPQFLDTLKLRTITEYQEHQPLEQIYPLEVNIFSDDNDETSDMPSAEDAHVNTFFALPLKVRNNVVGVLSLGSSHENLLNADILDTLHIFTNEASIVLDNARLYKQLEQSNLELEHTITELQETQAQLIQSEKMASLGQLVAGVAHEINTPAGAINAATSNVMHMLPPIVENFRRLTLLNLSPHDQDTVFSIVTHLILSTSKERKSTAEMRQNTKELEPVLRQQGFPSLRRLAKQIARLNLPPDDIQVLLRILQQYDSDTVMDFLDVCSKIISAVKDIRISIKIITRIVNALKMYSRIDQARVEEADIHEGIETTLIILNSQMQSGVTVERRYGDLPKILCYANELNQVWTNLMHNAIQAMKGQGTLIIETFLCEQEEAFRTNPSGKSRLITSSSEEMICVRVTDTGPGIPSDIRTKVFDPYFTTKDQGEGSGLGLGITRQIVERHHGIIRFTSEPGNTVFEVLLPLSGVQEAQQPS